MSKIWSYVKQFLLFPASFFLTRERIGGAVREGIDLFLDRLEERAKMTDNDLDDALVRKIREFAEEENLDILAADFVKEKINQYLS